jgi:hypothetical protein
MKTDEDNGEVDEPPEEPPCSECIAKKSEREENEELQWARNHRAQDPDHLPESRPASANSEPATEPAAQAAFRKTELWDKPPLFRSEEPIVRQKGPDRQVDEIHDRIDILEDRFELVIDRLERRISRLEEERES